MTVQEVYEELALHPAENVNWFKIRVALSGVQTTTRGQLGLDFLLDNRLTLMRKGRDGYGLYRHDLPKRLWEALCRKRGDTVEDLLESLGEWAEGNQ